MIKRIRESSRSVREMVSRLREFSDTIRQLVYLGVVAGVVILVPYFTIGIMWAIAHQDHLRSVHGLDWLLSTVGEIVAWPLLTIADIALV